MNSKPCWQELPIGGAVLKAGSTAAKSVAGWRTYRPIYDGEKCIHCLRCWILCPDAAIKVAEGKVVGIEYQHCKGCGICAHECPSKVKAITMRLESDMEVRDGG